MAEDTPKEPETLGELIEDIVGKSVPRAIDEARKAWAKDLADLLDLGADSSDTDPDGGPTSTDDPIVEPPVTEPTGVRGRKFSLL